MKIAHYNDMMAYLQRPPDKLSKEEKKKIVKDFYKKAEQPKPKAMEIVPYIKKMNSLYSNYDESEDPRYVPPAELEDIKKELKVSPLVKKEKDKKWKYTNWLGNTEPEEKKAAGIKDSALYKLLENPKAIGTELGHDTIMEIINLIQEPDSLDNLVVDSYQMCSVNGSGYQNAVLT